MDATQGWILNPEDFASSRISVEFRNLTSRAQTLPSDRASVQEVSEEALVLGLPRNSCATQHKVELAISWEGPSRKTHLSHVGGKVVSIELTDDPQIVRTTVELKHHDKSWDELLAYRAQRQEAITRFLAESNR